MKIKVKRSELEECVRRAVVRVLNESAKNKINEWVDDDDDDDSVLSRFLKDPKNDPKGGKKRIKGGGAAKAAAMKDIEAEIKASEKDDKAIADTEKKEMDKSTDSDE